jgi:hypothetical protein
MDPINLKKKYEDIVFGLLSGTGAFIGALIIFRENPIRLFKNSIPLGGDGLLTGIYIKIVNESSILNVLLGNIQSSQFGWPSKLNFNSYPIGSTFDVLSIKLFMKISGIIDPGQIVHIYSIGKAATIAITAYIFVRILNLNKWISLVIAISYSLNTYNIIRAEGHFLLGLTWQIPLMLSASYLAFSNSFKYPARNSRNKWQLILILFSFFAHFYYSIFWIIVNIFLSLIMIFKTYTNSELNEPLKLEKIILSLKHNLSLVSLTFISILSFMIQIIPIVLNQGRMSSFANTADRSPIESNVYSGDIESFFFDSYRFLFRIVRHPELTNYFASKISWEGSQFGVFSGFVVVSLIGLILFQLTIQGKNRKFSQAPIELQFIILTLIVTVFFYLKSPAQFILVQLIPQVRAWGRMSSFITVLLPILLFLLMKFYDVKKLVFVFMLGIMIVLNLVEGITLRADRPLSTALNVSSEVNKTGSLAIIGDLKKRYPQGCGIFQVPVYPFPEFDTPDDAVNDYAQFLVSINDNKYFKWTYGGIKATENAKYFQQLYSEFPPFTRATLKLQLDYANSMGACAIFIDRDALNNFERADLQSLLDGYPEKCVVSHKLGNSERYVEIDIHSKPCKPAPNYVAQELYSRFKNADFLWRVDEPANLQITNNGTFFEAKTKLHLRLTPIDKKAKTVRVYFQSTFQSGQSAKPAKVCFLTSNMKDTVCEPSKIVSQNQSVVEFKMLNQVNKVGKFILYLDPDWVSNNAVRTWAISNITS